MQISPQQLKLDVPGSGAVDAVLFDPGNAAACYVFAHGAGAGMRHPFMVGLSKELAAHGVATLRFQFPYMQQGSKRPDPPKIAHAAIRAAVAEAAHRLPHVPLFAGGKSYGGRMTSLAQSVEPLPGVRGIAFVGFPLHPPKEPGTERGDHLARVALPMLFLQGTRDPLAQLDLVRQTAASLGDRATLHVVEGGDHSFDVLKSSGRTEVEVRAELAATIVRWITQAAGSRAA